MPIHDSRVGKIDEVTNRRNGKLISRAGQLFIKQLKIYEMSVNQIFHLIQKLMGRWDGNENPFEI